MPDVDLLVVGGGILGLCLASLARERGLSVFVARLSDGQVPHADTLRNQGWLQSGLRYARDTDHALGFARKMRLAGQELHDWLALPPPAGFGVLRATDEGEAREYEGRALKLKLSVRRLDDVEAQSELGPLYQPGFPYLATPEVPFHEGRVLTELRAQLQSPPSIVKEGRVTLTKASPTTCSVAVDGVSIRARCTVLAAGAGNVPLLAGLGLEPLRLRQTPLLVAPCPPGVEARLFHDRISGFTLVRHDTNDGAKVVIGAGLQRSVDFVEPLKRKISTADEMALWNRMPQCILDLKEQARITAGMEPHVDDEDFRPWISTVGAFTGLFVAVPGRATIALDAAHNVLELVKTHLEGLPEPAPGVDPGPGTEWSGEICMHFEDYYRRLHDVESGATP